VPRAQSSSLASPPKHAFKTNVVCCDPPVVDSSIGEQIPGLPAQWNFELPLSKLCSAVAMLSRLSITDDTQVIGWMLAHGNVTLQ